MYLKKKPKFKEVSTLKTFIFAPTPNKHYFFLKIINLYFSYKCKMAYLSFRSDQLQIIH